VGLAFKLATQHSPAPDWLPILAHPERKNGSVRAGVS